MMETTGSYHLPIQTSILGGHMIDSNPSPLFEINVSHLNSLNFYSLLHFWKLIPCVVGDRVCMVWWEEYIQRNVKFMHG